MNGSNITFIWAQDRNGVIGLAGGCRLPWHVPGDLKWFNQYTIGKPVIYGAKTFQSLGCRPLPRRGNIVMSRSDLGNGQVQVANTVERAIELATEYLLANGGDEIIVSGGAQVFQLFLPYVSKLVISRLDLVVENNTGGGLALAPVREFNDWRLLEAVDQGLDQKSGIHWSVSIYVKN